MKHIILILALVTSACGSDESADICQTDTVFELCKTSAVSNDDSVIIDEIHSTTNVCQYEQMLKDDYVECDY